MLTTISTPSAPSAIGPYSQATFINGFLFSSGQGGVIPSTGAFAGDDIQSQTKQVMENLKNILQAADMDFSNVVKATCFLADMKDFKAFNEIYATYITHGPARSCVAVKELPLAEMRCEVEVIAAK